MRVSHVSSTVLRCASFALGLFCASASLAADGAGLVDAARNGNVDAVRSLLKGGADPNQTAPDGSTAVHWAVHADNLAMLNALLAAGAKPDAVTRYKITPLTLAAQNGNAALVERLLGAGANPDTASEEGQTALMTAARNGSVATVRALLKRGAQVGLAESFRGQTALMFAAGEGNTDAARLLLEFGAKRDERSKGGYTPLLFAVRNNRIETVTFLLAQGANVNDKIPDGTSALSLAILNADFDLAAMLLDSGADPNVPDPRGHPLHVVVWLHQPGAPPDFAMNGEDPRPVPRPRGKLSHLDIAKKLLEKGADPNVTITWGDPRFNSAGVARSPANLNIGRHYLTYQGATPFYLAARNGDEPMMRVLAAGGADPLKGNRFGVTPLMGAACLDYYEGETAGPFSGVPESQRLEAVKLAIALGNKINARTTFGDYKMIGTPEETLLKYPHNFRDLIDLGMGDPRFADMTALHGAVICNQPSIVKYLIEQGAEVNAKNRLGWTPLMIAGGLYIANAHKTSPGSAEILREAMAAQGLSGR
jgi:ankyrin repeat protein